MLVPFKVSDLISAGDTSGLAMRLVSIFNFAGKREVSRRLGGCRSAFPCLDILLGRFDRVSAFIEKERGRLPFYLSTVLRRQFANLVLKALHPSLL
jgi:hypothetical protein